jgi:hypothetical protein
MSANDIDLKALDRDLQKLGKPPRGWFSRNWKWLVPVLLLLIIVVGGGGYACWFFQRVFGNEAYKHSMTKILENKVIKASLGEPIQTVYLSPAPSIRKDASETDILWTIAGSAEKQAKVHVFQRLMSGKWETSIADVTLPDGKKVSLIDEEEGGAPLFQPQVTPAPDENANPPGKPAEENMPDDLSPKIPSPEDSK